MVCPGSSSGSRGGSSRIFNSVKPFPDVAKFCAYICDWGRSSSSACVATTTTLAQQQQKQQQQHDGICSFVIMLRREEAIALLPFIVPRTWCRLSAAGRDAAAIIGDSCLKQQLLRLLRPKLIGTCRSLLDYVNHFNDADGAFCVLFSALDGRSPMQMVQERERATGFTPLMTAAYRGVEPAMMTLLLATRADPNAQSHRGGTALTSACYVTGSSRGLRHIALLLEHHADPLLSDVAGDNALHCAAYSGCREAVDMILQAGVPLNVRNRGGWTALRYAYQEDHGDLAAYLVELGAVT